MTTLVMTTKFRPGIGGAITYTEEIYRRFPPGEIEVLAPRLPGDDAYDASAPWPIHRVRLRRGNTGTRFDELFPYPSLARALWRRVRRGGVGGLHCGDPLPSGLVALLFKRVLGLPYLLLVHGEELTTTRRLRYQSKALRAVLRGADAIVAGCGLARAEAVEIGADPSRVFVATPGVDVVRFRDGGPPPAPLQGLRDRGAKVIVTVGRLEARKGHDLVLRALPEVLARVPEAMYVIVGEGSDRPRLEAITSALGLEDRVLFVGAVAEQDLPGYYAGSDVFVMPNRVEPNGNTEGFGIVFIEASAAGKPVIGGLAGGVGDSIQEGETGYRVDPHDVEALAGRIGQLLQDAGEAKRLGEAGRRFAEGFSWDDRSALVRRLSQGLAPGSGRR